MNNKFNKEKMPLRGIVSTVISPFKDDPTHKVGYFAYYNNGLFDKGPVPLVLGFHGGGDSAYATASLAEWPEIGQKEGFMTVAVEMHMAVSAKEVAAPRTMLVGRDEIVPRHAVLVGENQVVAFGYL